MSYERNVLPMTAVYFFETGRIVSAKKRDKSNLKFQIQDLQILDFKFEISLVAHCDDVSGLLNLGDRNRLPDHTEKQRYP